ncbi:hypothetical protein Scep_021921 [Stephania cephalantha]|uniref:Transmembrane protein n=1 Tax=Stephania cephalantha TaxID=152367 RepID=A0AAP0F9W3_9MAGN
MRLMHQSLVVVNPQNDQTPLVGIAMWMGVVVVGVAVMKGSHKSKSNNVLLSPVVHQMDIC